MNKEEGSLMRTLAMGEGFIATRKKGIERRKKRFISRYVFGYFEVPVRKEKTEVRLRGNEV